MKIGSILSMPILLSIEKCCDISYIIFYLFILQDQYFLRKIRFLNLLFLNNNNFVFFYSLSINIYCRHMSQRLWKVLKFETNASEK